MYKHLVLILILLIGVSFDAKALVRQKASEALSYRNVVSGTLVTTSSLKPTAVLDDHTTTDPLQLQTVDMLNSVSKSVSVSPNEQFVVQVPEVASYGWDISYDANNLALSGNEVDEDVRNIMFMQRSEADSAIYLDKVDSSLFPRVLTSLENVHQEHPT